MQLSPKTLQELQKGGGFGFDDGLHHQLPGAIQYGHRDRFFVNVEPDILNVATHVELPPWGKVIRGQRGSFPQGKVPYSRTHWEERAPRPSRL
jgi:hypothetical protein